MKDLEDIFRQGIEDLKQLGTEIVALETDLISFELRAASYHVEQVGQRLQQVCLWAVGKVVEEYEKHGNQGCVGIMSAHKGAMRVVWFEEETIITDAVKSWTAPVTTLPEEQFFIFIKQLLRQLDSGDWESAVRWLNANAIWLTTGEHL